MVQAATDALASATSLAAHSCRLGDRKGRLHPGYDADLTVVDGDPHTSIAALTAVRAGCLGGQGRPAFERGSIQHERVRGPSGFGECARRRADWLGEGRGHPDRVGGQDAPQGA